jgi:hypothetical protein
MAISTKLEKSNSRLFSALHAVQQCIADACFIYCQELISQTHIRNRRLFDSGNGMIMEGTPCTYVVVILQPLIVDYGMKVCDHTMKHIFQITTNIF